MPVTCPGHSDYMASAAQILLIFKYQTAHKMNIKAGLQAIATAQLDAHLWRRRKRRRNTAKRKSSWSSRKLDTEAQLKGTAAIGKRASWIQPWAGNLKTTCDFKSWFNQTSTKPQQTQHRYVTAGSINLCKSGFTQKFTNSPQRDVEREFDLF